MRKLAPTCLVLASLVAIPAAVAGNPDRGSGKAATDRVVDNGSAAFVADRHLALYRATRAALHHVKVVQNADSTRPATRNAARVSAYVMPRSSATAALPLTLPQPVTP